MQSRQHKVENLITGLVLIPGIGHFFKDFDVHGENNFISRNTISHGVVDSSAFTKKSSLIGFLILDQIHRYTSIATSFELRDVQKYL
jgi:hypothetical protein